MFVYNIASSVKKHRLYADFIKVKSRLAEHQFVCWIVGGAVRDFCLGREVGEFDLVTDATTENLKVLFPEAVLVGESFGVLKIPIAANGSNTEFFDLTTFRQESDYLDGRRPSKVSAATPLKDSERRDFTINAMFWDDQQNQIIDYQRAQLDLLSRHLSCVGSPDVRFVEDYLRIIRLVRFASILNFQVDSKAQQSAFTYRSKVNQISGERIWAEFLKIDKAVAWSTALKQELFVVLLKEIFGIKEIKLKEEQKNITSIYLFVYLLDPAIDFSDMLKKRLKLSNNELAIYHSIRVIINAIEKFSLEEVAFVIEKNIGYLERLQMLVEAQLVSENKLKSIKNILNNHSEVLLAAKDLVNLIPNQFISEELKNVRLAQFTGKYKTKAEALDYLNKKYATQSEKT